MVNVMGYIYVHNVTLHILIVSTILRNTINIKKQQIADKYKVGRTTISYILEKERSTTIPNGSTSEANADGSGVQSQD